MPRNRGTKMSLEAFAGNADDELPTAPMQRVDDGPQSGRADSGQWGRRDDRPQRHDAGPSRADEANQWRRGPSSGAPLGGGYRDRPSSGGGGGGSSWRDREKAPLSTSNRFDAVSRSRNPWEDPELGDTRPAHLRNRFKNTQDSRFSAPAPALAKAPTPSQAPQQPKKQQAMPKYEKKARKANAKLASTVSADQLHSPLEIAIDERRGINGQQLATSFARLDLQKTPISDAGLVLTNSLHDKKYTPAELITAVQTSNDVKAATSLLLAIVKGAQAKSAQTLSTLFARAQDKKTIITLLGGGRTGEALNKYFISEGLECLVEDEAITQLADLLSSGADVATVLAAIPSTPSPHLKGAVVMGLLARLFEGQTLNLDVLDSFAPVLARVKNDSQTPLSVALDIDILFEAQRVWFVAGGSKDDIRRVFVKLYETEVVSFEGVSGWRDDRKRGIGNKKPVVSLAVVSWIAEITPPPEPEERDEEADEDDEEGGGEDDDRFDI